MLRIALIGNTMETMLRFRGPLILELVAAGHDVVAICPNDGTDGVAALANLGARHLALTCISQRGLDPRGELRLLRELIGFLRTERIDCVFAYFVKPVIWGAFAARRARVPRCVGMIEGLGSAFSAPPIGVIPRLRQRIARIAVLVLLRLALAHIDQLIVLNQDDAALLCRRRLIACERITVIDGIGVDLDYYAPAPAHLKPFRFTLAARLIREKGVEIFAKAAARIVKIYPNVRFRLLGGIDKAPGAPALEKIAGWVQEGFLEWPGKVSDVRPHLRETSVFVLPTLYSEGLPRSIMEAMAMGRPVITSDMSGARTSITDGESGIIVPAGNVDALVDACTTMLTDQKGTQRMGQYALVEARRRYDVRHQNRVQMDIILGPLAIRRGRLLWSADVLARAAVAGRALPPPLQPVALAR